MKKFAAILCCAALLTSLTGCGGDEGSNTTGGSVSTEVIEPTLYSMDTALDKVYKAAGYNYDYETPLDGQKVLDKYCAQIDVTWYDVLLAFDSDKPEEEFALIKLFQTVGISPTDINWDTLGSIYAMPNTVYAPERAENLTEDRDEFIAIIRESGPAGYKNNILMSKGEIPDIGAISVPIFEECLNDEMTYKRIYEKYEFKKGTLEDNQLLFKTSERDTHFWVYTERNGHCYIAFYPTVSNMSNSAKYLAELDPNSGTPLWQHYFCAYATWAIDSYDVDMSKGIYNVTNDGVEVWWPLNNGERSLEIDVYESGLIRVVMSSDGRYDSYAADNLEFNSLFDDEDYSYFSENYGFSNADVDTLAELAKIFQLPYANEKDPSKWAELSEIYMDALYVANHPEDLDKVTVADIENSLERLCRLTKPEGSGVPESTNTTPLSDILTRELVENDLRADLYLTAIGASDSTLFIGGYNSTSTTITYVKPRDPREDEHKERFTKLCEDELFLHTMNVWCDDVMALSNVSMALADDYRNIDHDWFSTFLDAVEEINISKNNNFGTYFKNLQDLTTIDAGPIVYTAIYNIDDLPESLQNIEIYSASDMSAADDYLNQLIEALGSSFDKPQNIYRLYAIAEESEDDTSSPSTGNTSGGGAINW